MESLGRCFGAVMSGEKHDYIIAGVLILEILGVWKLWVCSHFRGLVLITYQIRGGLGWHGFMVAFDSS